MYDIYMIYIYITRIKNGADRGAACIDAAVYYDLRAVIIEEPFPMIFFVFLGNNIQEEKEDIEQET